MSPTRLPRFKRVSSIRAIELTDRDREILIQVHRHRFLRSTQLVALLGGSRQHILRRELAILRKKTNGDSWE